jgi:hypothetical protein
MTKISLPFIVRSHSHLLQSWQTHSLLISANACSLTSINFAPTLVDTFFYVNI